MSLGKLDAICARLKSFQQPQGKSATNLTTDGDRTALSTAQDFPNGKAQVTLTNGRKISPQVIRDDKGNGDLGQGDPAAISEHCGARTNGSSGTATEGSPLDTPVSSSSPSSVSSSNNNNSKTADFNARIPNGVPSNSSPVQSEPPSSPLALEKSGVELANPGNPSSPLESLSGNSAVLAGDAVSQKNSVIASTAAPNEEIHPEIPSHDSPAPSSIVSKTEANVSHSISSPQGQTTNKDQRIESTQSNKETPNSSPSTTHSTSSCNFSTSAEPVSGLHTPAKEKTKEDTDTRLIEGDSLPDLGYNSLKSSPSEVESSSLEHQTSQKSNNLRIPAEIFQKSNAGFNGDEAAKVAGDKNMIDRTYLSSETNSKEYEINVLTKDSRDKNSDTAKDVSFLASSNQLKEVSTSGKDCSVANDLTSIPKSVPDGASALKSREIIGTTTSNLEHNISFETSNVVSTAEGCDSESPENNEHQKLEVKTIKKIHTDVSQTKKTDSVNVVYSPVNASSVVNSGDLQSQHIPAPDSTTTQRDAQHPGNGNNATAESGAKSPSSATNAATDNDPKMCNNHVRADGKSAQSNPSHSHPASSKHAPAPAGRKKSRKAAKPKKQPVFSQLVMEQDLSDSEPLIEGRSSPALDEPRNLITVVSTGLKEPEFSLPIATAPLDLTGSQHKAGGFDSGQTLNDLSLPTNSVPEETAKANKDGKERYESCKESKPGHEEAEKTRATSGNESTPVECKGLVDFAHNTMQELLGIYGLEESAEARGSRLRINPSSLPQTPVGQQLGQDEYRKSANETDSSSLGAGKSRPFRKNVYTSLAHHAVDSTSASPLALNPVPESLSSDHFHLIRNSSSNNNSSCSNSNDSTPVPSPSLSATAVVGRVAMAAAAAQGAKKIYTQRPPSSSDVSKFIKRYMCSEECRSKVCHELGYKDHYHCLDCQLKVFVRKEEMIRHYKWHKKRQESLQHGFMRYSPDDDCSVKYTGCAHNGRQTHYHCVQHNCDKVYVSTSDVQMHANFHRKDSAIIQEGFQRFRATEDCGTPSCAFYGHRTTHFHCRRPQCNFTFKNKADMEKHKSYHQKDEVLSKDGFKKFMKYEVCPYPGCRFSKVSNHIHCIRPGCQYVLHSTAQLYSHKRKHERREFESAYRNYRELQHPGVASEGQETSIALAGAEGQQAAHLQFPVASVTQNLFNRDLGLPIKRAAVSEPGLSALDLSEASQTSHLSSAGPSTPESAAARESMALPVKVLPPQVVKDDPETLTDSEAMEPEDLSLPHRKRKLSLDSKDEHGGTPAKVIKSERYTDDSLMASDNVATDADERPAMNGTCGNSSKVQENVMEEVDEDDDDDEEEEDDDEDDDDDDDKDYGQVEEPTLVNACFSSPEVVEENTENSTQSLPEASPVTGKVETLKQESSPVESDGAATKNPNTIGFNMNLQKQLLEATQRPHSLCIPQMSDLKPSQPGFGLYSAPVFTGKRNGPGRPRKRWVETCGTVKVEAQPGSSGMSSSGTVGQPVTLDQKQGIVGDSGPASMMGIGKQSSLDLNELVLKSAVLKTGHTPQALLNPEGKVWGLHIPIKLADKRDRDENWKNYLIRYTANDACFSRCACLYKDHYHCRIEGCKVTFKSKDGVRGHARFHELQDSISPMVFRTVSGAELCPVGGCRYSHKEDHYHCNWVDCNQVIPSSAPTFARLEHYRIHEFSMPSANRGAKTPSSARAYVDPFQKRRGRPPKYVKHQIVPKVYLTEQEITDSTLAYLHNQPYKNNSILNGFKRFQGPEEMCPDQRCIFRGKVHYHCGRKQCHMSTDRLDVLNLHAKDFHNNVTILEGFEFFERMVDCRRTICHNNRTNRHYHCMRPRCDYSFVRHSTMIQHNKKHPTVTSAVLSPPLIQPQGRVLGSNTRGTTALSPGLTKSFGVGSYVPIAPAVTSSPNSSLQLAQPSSMKTSMPPTAGVATSPTSGKTIKSAGTFFPLSGLSSMAVGQFGNQVSSAQLSNSEGIIQTLASGCAGQIISGAQIFQTAGNTQVLSTAGGMCLAIPQSLASTPLPLLAAQGNQPGMITNLIPLSQLSSLVSLPGGQLVATSQGQILQPAGTNVVHVLQNPPPVQPQQAAPSQPVASTSSGMAPLAMLLQHHQMLQQKGLSPPLSWAALRERMHFSVKHNCGRPFCKLKKRDHYHCLDCNQAFSDPTRLRSHIGKHGFKFKKKKYGGTSGQSQSMAVDSSHQDAAIKSDNKVNLSDEDGEEELSSSLNLQPSVFTSMVSTAEPGKGQVCSTVSSGVDLSPSDLAQDSSLQEHSSSLNNNSAGDLNSSVVSSSSSDSRQEEFPESPSLVIDDSCDESNESSLNASSSSLTLCSSLSGRKSGRKRLSTQSKDFISSDSAMLPKPFKVHKATWGTRSHSDVPKGYKRVRCGEDCGYVRCAYRQTVTHFHCLRSDCGYGFSDKSRITQHTMRHERLDMLMGDDFQQYRASVSCQRADCEFDEKASHFHCLKCPYSCADSSKVPAHRKYHAKLDNINSNGFTKFSGTADCQIASCAYFRKQTHYHCTFQGCTHAVLGPSQMAPHKLKHAQHQVVK